MLFHRSGKELAIGKSIDFSTLPCIFHGGFKFFNSDYISTLLCQPQGYASRPTVSIDQGLFSGFLGPLTDKSIKFFCLFGMDLEKGTEGKVKGQLSEFFAITVFAPQHLVFGAHDYVGILRIGVLNQTDNAKLL